MCHVHALWMLVGLTEVGPRGNRRVCVSEREGEREREGRRESERRIGGGKSEGVNRGGVLDMINAPACVFICGGQL